MYILPLILQTLFWPPTRLVLHFFAHFKVLGKENLTEIKHGAIFAANHLDELDPILLPAAIGPFSRFMPMFYVSLGKECYDHLGPRSFFYGATIFKVFGAYSAEVGVKNYERSLAKHIDLLKSGKNVCIFPESKRSHDGNLLPPKGGVVALAKVTGKPIVPVALSGHLKMTWGDLFMRRRTIVINFGKPIEVEKLFTGFENATHKDYKTIANKKVMEEISKLLDRQGCKEKTKVARESRY